MQSPRGNHPTGKLRRFTLMAPRESLRQLSGLITFCLSVMGLELFCAAKMEVERAKWRNRWLQMSNLGQEKKASGQKSWGKAAAC